MKVVVTGASGHIGTYLVPMLINAGYEVVGITRREPKPYEWDPAWERVTSAKLDRSAPDFYAKIAAMQPDVVVDLISFTLADAQAMVQALRETRCSHYLYCSSCWANGRAELLPSNSDMLNRAPLCEYGRQKAATEAWLHDLWRREGFAETVVAPGQISGPGWDIIGPWGTVNLTPFQKIANGEAVELPNFGMETLHHVHGYDVAQVFFRAIERREAALGQTFNAMSGQDITLYGYVRLLASWFGTDPAIEYLGWNEFKGLLDSEEQAEHAYLHLARSGYYSIEKEQRLLGYAPKYTNVDTIKLAVDSYVKRGLITVG